MNSIKSKTPLMLLSVLALGGMIAAASPANAGDYDDFGTSSVPVVAPWVGDQAADQMAEVPSERGVRASTQAKSAAEAREQVEIRRANNRAAAEARRLQQ